MLRCARGVAIALSVASCVPADRGLAGAAVSTLGARDGYVFVVSPFNCFLGSGQIDVLNAIARRARRSGVILAAGGAATNDSVAIAAVSELGIRMQTRRLSGSAVGRELARLRWQPPILIAIQHGEIVGTLSGTLAQDFDSWIPWIEGQSVRPAAGGNR